MYMDDTKVSAKNEKEQETLIQTIRIYNQDKGMEFSIKKWTLPIIKRGKTEKQNKNWRSESGKYQDAESEGKLQIFGNIGSGHH